ncbi:hypothetical protein MBLNU459_g3778t1 [Dothideomycetes sp. NU459]
MEFRRIRRPINLILDWDGTLTRKDTLHLVGQIGYQQKSRLATSADPPIPPWSHFGSAYMDDLAAHQKQYSDKPETRTTLDQERAWLKSLAPVENRSVRRVEESGLFRGVQASDVDRTTLFFAEHAAHDERLQLRTSWARLFSHALAAGPASAAAADPSAARDAVSILSVNWSERFIRQSLLHASESAAACASDRSALAGCIAAMPIVANEIGGLDGPGGGDGSLTRPGSAGVRTSSDKLARLPLRCQARLAGEAGRARRDPDRPDADADVDVDADAGGTVVYVGDSATDFEALLAADVGICVRDEPMGSGQQELAETLRRVGVAVVHVGDRHTAPDAAAAAAAAAAGSRGRTVYWAKDLGEIADLLQSADT